MYESSTPDKSLRLHVCNAEFISLAETEKYGV